MHKPQGSIFRDHHFHKHPAQSTEFNIQASSFSNTLCTKHRVRYSGIIILLHILHKPQGSIFKHHHPRTHTSCTKHRVQFSGIISLTHILHKAQSSIFRHHHSHTHLAQSTEFNIQASSFSHTSCTKHRVQFSGIIILHHTLNEAQGSIFRHHHSHTHSAQSTGFNIQASSFSHTPCIKHRVDHPILHKDVEAAVQILKKEKSAGVDNIPAELVQAGGEDVITALTTICNKIWQT